MQGRSEIRRLRSVCETTLKNYLCIQLSVSLSLACSLALSLSLCLYLYVSLLYRERQIRPTHLHARENVREVNTRISLNFTCVYVYICIHTYFYYTHTHAQVLLGPGAISYHLGVLHICKASTSGTHYRRYIILSSSASALSYSSASTPRARICQSQ